MPQLGLRRGWEIMGERILERGGEKGDSEWDIKIRIPNVLKECVDLVK